MDGDRQLRRLPPGLGGGAALSGTSVPADDFVDRLLAAGIDFATGVPCSLVGPLIAALERRGLYHGETREDAALGVAAGAYLGGRLPAVIMQNSGLGVSLNALGSLHLLYGVPTLLLVTWRGFGGADAPEHLVMGAVLPRLLDLFEIPHRAPAPSAALADVDWAVAATKASRKPVALVVRPGLFGADHA